MKEPAFDLDVAHRHFAAHCFNAAWKLLERRERSALEEEELVALGHASLWHWLQRADCSDKNLSVAYWMLARIYATLRRAEAAKHYAALCAAKTDAAQLPAFYRGCAHEALARAFHVAGDVASRERHLAEGRAIAVGLEGDEKAILSVDLESVAS